ncbi:glycosyltransferase family 39 protein [Candidatus Saccharibacteria bacterium]|nr:glycosyltransferase family 39 protein [Candidatus Saccharibacteria bacterium]
MSKLVISRLFLYRYRFYIGYILLGLAFTALLFGIPLISPAGLSEAEMASAVSSYNLHFSSVTSGDLVDLPYHVLQKLCILAFGMTPYVIKLPSILIGLLLGLLLILLLNRWFKSNVALLASILAVLSTSFLYLAGSGTPLIMLVFWPTLLLWLGSKIQGEKSPNPIFCYVFALALLLSIYTPHLIYLVLFIIFFTLWNPHLRFTVKSLPKVPLIAMGILLLAGFAMWLTNLFSSSSVALSLFFAKDFSFSQVFSNIKTGFLPFFMWKKPLDGVYLSPLIGLAEFALALTGLFSTRKGFLASRNAIASCFIVFSVLLAGLVPDSALLLLLPFAILTAHGLRYLLEKWYGLFPENPYARIFAIFPLGILLSLMIIPSLNHYVYGYRYTPIVASEFSSDLSLVSSSLDDETYLYIADDPLTYRFFEVYEDRTHAINLLSDLSLFEKTSAKPTLATLGKAASLPEHYHLTQIITSPKSDNSDRIYIYRYFVNN